MATLQQYMNRMSVVRTVDGDERLMIAGVHRPSGVAFTLRRGGTVIALDTHHPDGEEAINIWDHARGRRTVAYGRVAVSRAVARWLKTNDYSNEF